MKVYLVQVKTFFDLPVQAGQIRIDIFYKGFAIYTSIIRALKLSSKGAKSIELGYGLYFVLAMMILYFEIQGTMQQINRA